MPQQLRNNEMVDLLSPDLLLRNEPCYPLLYYSVMGFGAKGDGITDDTAAIQAALTATPNGGTLFIQYTAGGYKFFGPLTCVNNIEIIGGGKSMYTAPCAKLINYADADGLVLSSANVSGLYIADGFGAGRSQGAGIVVKQESHITDVIVTGHQDGFRLQRVGTGAYLVEMERAYARDNLRYGFNAVAWPGVAGTSLTFIGTYAGNNGDDGYHIDGSYMYLAFLNAASGDNLGAGFAFTGANPNFSMTVSMISPGAEHNTKDGIYILDSVAFTIIGAQLMHNVGDGIHIDGATKVTLIGSSITDNTGFGINVTTSATPVVPGDIMIIGARLAANTAGDLGPNVYWYSDLINCDGAYANLGHFHQKVTARVGLGVGNSAVATTLGDVIAKIEIFDMAGASLGYLPVYDAIT